MDELVFQKRTKKLRKAVVLWSFILLILGGALIGASWFVLYGDFFKVREFEVIGSRSVDGERFLNLMKNEMFSASLSRAILGPDNILFWQFGGRPESLPELPIVSVASLDVNLAERKVAVKVMERKIEGIICRGKDECYGFDDKGVVFSVVPHVEGYLILKIDDQNSRPFVLGSLLFPRDEWRENLFKTLSIFRDRDITVSAVRVKDYRLEEWEAETAAGLKFLFSLDFVPENLGGILENLDEQFDFGKLAYFDFRVPNRIYYK
ncbi:MAG TPA: hypothetical protein VNK70_02780 [Candidatus Paceibacterota bacterium]|nr:hypothetical protein [Candidatus Paceibacterota bacterium]